MSNYVITIGREYGSGGRIIGENLAHQLGIGYYDDKLIELTAKESGFDPEAISKFESKRTSSFLYSTYMSSRATTLSDDIFLAQSKAIEKLSQKESCVIVSHCADYILRNNPNVFKIFIYAPLEERVERSRSQYVDNATNFESFVKKQDKKRADYYNYFTPNKWGDRKNYHLMLNSTIGIESCVNLLKSMTEKLYGGNN
jgi:hypothetical protein